jgi:hypothetical protein
LAYQSVTVFLSDQACQSVKVFLSVTVSHLETVFP